MADFTSRLSLKLPGGGSTGTILPPEPVDIDVINENMRKLDTSVGAAGYTSTARPSSPYDGQLAYETDTTATIRYNQATTAWEELSYRRNPHAEFTTQINTLADNTIVTAGTVTLDAARSFNAPVTTINGGVRVPSAGTYIFLWQPVLNLPATGRTYAEISLPSISPRNFITSGEDTWSVLTTPYYFAAATDVLFRIRKQTGGIANVSGRIIVDKVGG